MGLKYLLASVLAFATIASAEEVVTQTTTETTKTGVMPHDTKVIIKTPAQIRREAKAEMRYRRHHHHIHPHHDVATKTTETTTTVVGPKPTTTTETIVVKKPMVESQHVEVTTNKTSVLHTQDGQQKD